MDILKSILIRSITIAIITLAVPAILGLINNHNYKEQKNTVYFPRPYFWVGLVGDIVFSTGIILMYAFPNGTGGLWVAIIFSLFILMGIYIMLLVVNWRIVYDDNGFKYKTFLGRSFHFKYEDVKRIKRTKNNIYLYTERRILYIETMAIGVDEFFYAMSNNQIKSLKRR